MKAHEIISKLFEYGADADYSTTCDTLKCGSPDTEVTKIAVTMFPTVDVIKKASAWGAELLIVHEPTYYNHFDTHSDEAIENEKRVLLEDSGMTVFRFHDHPHRNFPDLISAGEYKFLGLDGEIDYCRDIFGLSRVRLNEAMTPLELACIIEERLGVKHVRICGNRDIPCTNISGYFGAPGDVLKELQRKETEVLLIGEACEWSLAEYARDASQLGYKKTLIIMGHVGSERAGMVYISELLKQKCPELEVEYFESDEVYTYTDM